MEGGGLNPVDIAVIAIVLVSALMAFARGFVREVLSVAAWVGAAFVTLYAFPLVAPEVRLQIDSRWLADGATVLGVFTLSLVVFSVLTHMVSGRVQESSLSAIDRSLGFAFGVLRGAVIVSLGYMFMGWLWSEPPQWLQEARTRPLMAAGAQTLREMLPNANLDPAQREAERLRRQAEEAIQAQRALERLANPQPPTGPATPDTDQGYTAEQRNRMEQLIRNTAEPEPPPSGQ